jgi:aminoglycoside 3-N-acetyltransferase
MGESQAIARAQSSPATIQSLCADLSALGVEPGMLLLVHSSLSSLGWVCGGPVAVVLALEQALGPLGTLMMPTHSGDLSDPANWQNPPVPEAWWKTIRETMPPYDSHLTPTRGMGVIPETFRRQAGVLRSIHPQVSFAAWGARAEKVVTGQTLDFGLGEGSPLARIYDLEGWVLLLGVGHESNTSLHLAEYRAAYPSRRLAFDCAPVMVDGERQWVTIRDLDLDPSDFAAIGETFERDTGNVARGRVACAQALLMSQRSLINYAVAWIERHRL